MKVLGIKISKQALAISVIAFLALSKTPTKTTNTNTISGGTGTGPGTGSGTGTGTTTPTTPSVPVPVPTIPVSVFPDVFANVAVETIADTFSPEQFSAGEIATSYDSILGMNIPDWIVTLQTDLSKVYKAKNVTLKSRGIWGSVDTVHQTEGTEWNFFLNPETGQPFENNYNTRKNVNLNLWESPLLLEQRMNAWGNHFLDMQNKTETEIYNIAKEVAGSNFFGGWFKNETKKNIGLVNLDLEGFTDSIVPLRIQLKFFKTLCESIKGIAHAMYLDPIKTELGYLSTKGYPDENGVVNVADINPAYVTKENIDGVNYNLADSVNLAPVIEISHWGETTYEGFFDGQRNCTAFGANSNIEHYLARVVSLGEKNYSYLKSIGREKLLFLMPKVICDRGGYDLEGWQYANANRKGGGPKIRLTQYLPRDFVFKEELGTFFSGCNLHEWNRPVTGLISDCMNGFDAAIDLLKTPKNFQDGNTPKSAVDMRRGGTFDLWKTKYKLTGETEYRQEKGYQLKDNKDNLLARTLRLGNLVAYCIINPYNVATKLSGTIATSGSGYRFVKEFAATDWKSCYPAQPERKDYIFGIEKMEVL